MHLTRNELELEQTSELHPFVEVFRTHYEREKRRNPTTFSEQTDLDFSFRNVQEFSTSDQGNHRMHDESFVDLTMSQTLISALAAVTSDFDRYRLLGGESISRDVTCFMRRPV